MNFSQITPNILPIVTGTVQALDNQWVPRNMLQRMILQRKTLNDVQIDRSAFIKKEFMRSIINLESIVVNRANLLNNDILSEYTKINNPERYSYKNLFERKIIIPFLFDETTPIIYHSNYSSDHDNVKRWNELCLEIENMSCLRLSWNNTQNQELITNKISRRFHDRVMSLSSLPNHSNLAMEMGLDASAGNALKLHFGNIAMHCLQGLMTTGKPSDRSAIYSSFVIASGQPSHLGHYCSSKPHAQTVKECIDLIYNSTLSDAIGRYPLTPEGSANRRVLQEIEMATSNQSIQPNQVLNLIRGAVFDISQELLCLDGYDKISISDVLSIRESDEWIQYMESMRNTIQNPMIFVNPEAIQDLYFNYILLARTITKKITKKRIQSETKKWSPIAKILIEIGGRVALEVWYTPDGTFYSIAEIAIEFIAEKSAPFVARMMITGSDIIRGHTREQADFDASLVLWAGQMDYAGEKLKEIIKMIKENTNFTDSRHSTSPYSIPGVDQGQ